MAVERSCRPRRDDGRSHMLEPATHVRAALMSTTTKLRRIGNRDGLTFRAEQLREAGFVRGDRIVVEAQPGRIMLSKADSPVPRPWRPWTPAWRAMTRRCAA